MRGGIGPDTIEEVWWRAWTAFAIPHGHDVFAGQWQDFPPFSGVIHGNLRLRFAGDPSGIT